MQTTLDLDQIRDEFAIGDHISDDVMSAFASNWFNSDDVEWSELEYSFCGIYGGLDEDDSIGDYLFDVATDCGDLDSVPDYIRNNIDWVFVGRDARFNGKFRAERLPDSYDWVVFRNF